MTPENSSKIKRYIFGAGAHGRVVADIFASQGQYLNGFVDDTLQLRGQSVAGLPVVGTSADMLFSNEIPRCEVIVAFGVAPVRLDVSTQLRKLGHVLINAIHASAVISPTASLGGGISACAGSVVNPDAWIGDAVIINTHATIDHDCQIGHGCQLSPGVHLSGRVTIGMLSFLGVGVSVAPRVSIGDHTIVGAGAVVVKDLPSGVLAYGVPARIICQIDDSFDWSRLL
jgi:sugar O-acyltransferase (sialic acid O-acetyltransferase NeuD family)